MGALEAADYPDCLALQSDISAVQCSYLKAPHLQWFVTTGW
jgi:hypothetical protein